MKSSRILIVITTAFVPTGGLASVMMNYYRKMDKSTFRIDFASTNEAPAVLINELNEFGSRYYCLGKRNNIRSYFFKLKTLCKNYDVIHINANSATAVIELLAATLAGVKVRIDHNHTTHTEHPYLNIILKPLLEQLCDIGLACSEDAGKWLFGEGRFTVLRNAIDVDKYRFSASLRQEYRKKWNIPIDAFVIGHVGKINTPKNHFKLLDVFYEYQKIHSNAMLLCVGYGPLRGELEEKIVNLGLQGIVFITGERTDIPGFLSAMDVFVFPSKWEGLGMAVIEAQASGLPCLVSDQVPKDVYLSEQVESLMLENNAKVWANKIEEVQIQNRSLQSERNIRTITSLGYNIETEAYYLQEIYEKGILKSCS